jgi:class 3 adenylate cyclase
MPPEINYAVAADGARLAYQVIGDGPTDLLYVPQSISAGEVVWEYPMVSGFFERLASFARLITFDRRGSGLSSSRGAPLPLEEQIDDVRAVLDAAGSERAGVLALYEGGPMAMLLAATLPDRVSSLVLYACQPRLTKAEDYDWAPTAEERRAGLAEALDNWGKGSDMADFFAPSHAGDPRLAAFLGALQRRSMAPDEWERVHDLNAAVDVRPVLPSIRVPTLVLHRTLDPAMDVRHSRYVAEHIPDAKLVELDGSDSLMFVGDSEAVLGEIEEFITGARAAVEPDRVLATVLFTDIVGSTQRAASMGDQRWREILVEHHRAVRSRVSAHGGREIKTIGDGVLATFDGPARGVRAARAIVEDAFVVGLEVRAGLHTGEIEVIGDDVGGMAVHIGARVSSEAGPGEVLVSGTVKDLVVGSGLEFAERGRRELKGVPGEWALWSVRG